VALRGCGQWLISWQHRSGLPPARRPTWPCSLIALHLLGYALDHPVLASWLSWLTAATSQPRQVPGSARLAPVRLPPVLETTLAVDALADAGVAADHAALLAAGRWLLLQRIEGPAGPGAGGGVEPSGWSFGRDGYPVLADTARVLLALSRVRFAGLTAQPAIRNATRWLTSMQGRDGSWNGSAAVTAYAVRALATHGAPDLHAIRRGVVWLLRQQQAGGCWPGPDGDGDLAVTAAVLHALVSAGVRPAKPPVRSAVAWLLHRQMADAGWAFAAHAAGSQAQATACALTALLATGRAMPGAGDAVDRAADWLVRAQQPDGGWRDEPVRGGRSTPRRRGPLVPGLLMPLGALGRYVS
jgi:squalene-hopene/tetraprenyl-beta-curcumene cyclase